MATSPYGDTVFIMDLLGRMFYGRPFSVLDIGSGFGRCGFLLRCHMGCGVSLTTQSPQQMRLEAIEAFPGNITPIYDCIYDKTHHGDVLDVLPSLGEYDVILDSHMLEHLEKQDGLSLLEQMVAHTKSVVVVALPLGEWPQGEIHGNSYEVHRAAWQEADFARFRPYIKTFGSDAVVIIPCDSDARWQVKMMRSLLRRCVQRIRVEWHRYRSL